MTRITSDFMIARVAHVDGDNIDFVFTMPNKDKVYLYEIVYQNSDDKLLCNYEVLSAGILFGAPKVLSIDIVRTYAKPLERPISNNGGFIILRCDSSNTFILNGYANGTHFQKACIHCNGNIAKITGIKLNTDKIDTSAYIPMAPIKLYFKRRGYMYTSEPKVDYVLTASVVSGVHVCAKNILSVETIEREYNGDITEVTIRCIKDEKPAEMSNQIFENLMNGFDIMLHNHMSRYRDSILNNFWTSFYLVDVSFETSGEAIDIKGRLLSKDSECNSSILKIPHELRPIGGFKLKSGEYYWPGVTAQGKSWLPNVVHKDKSSIHPDLMVEIEYPSARISQIINRKRNFKDMIKDGTIKNITMTDINLLMKELGKDFDGDYVPTDIVKKLDEYMGNFESALRCAHINRNDAIKAFAYRLRILNNDLEVTKFANKFNDTMLRGTGVPREFLHGIDPYALIAPCLYKIIGGKRSMFRIKDVKFSGDRTIVFWECGDKTIVKMQDDEKVYDPEKAIMAAYMKRVLEILNRTDSAKNCSMDKILDKYLAKYEEEKQEIEAGLQKVKQRKAKKKALKKESEEIDEKYKAEVDNIHNESEK